MYQLYYLAIPLLGIHPREIKVQFIYKNIYGSILHNNPRQGKFQNVHQKENGQTKLCYIYKMEYLAIKRNRILIYTTTWMDLKATAFKTLHSLVLTVINFIVSSLPLVTLWSILVLEDCQWSLVRTLKLWPTASYPTEKVSFLF